MENKQTIGQKKILAASMPEAKKFWELELKEIIPSSYMKDFYDVDELYVERSYLSSSKTLGKDVYKKFLKTYNLTEVKLPEVLMALIAAFLYINKNGIEEDFTFNYSQKVNGNSECFPVHVKMEKDIVVSELIHQVITYVERATQYSKYPTDLLIENFDIVVNVLEYEEYCQNYVDNKAILNIYFIYMPDDSISITIKGDTRYYLEESIKNFSNHLLLLIKKCAESDNKILNTNLYSEYDERLFTILNDTDNPYSNNKTLVELFEQTFEKKKELIAVYDGEVALTFGDLDVYTQRVAAYLEENCDSSEKFVGVFCKRSFHFLVCVIGIMRSGRAYLPFDVKAPNERNKIIFEKSKIKSILCEEEFEFKIPQNIRILSINEAENSTLLFKRVKISPEDLAYIIFTSGSTGIPKGVCVKHESVINRLEWMQRRFPLVSKDIILHKTPSTFDVSVWELFWWTIVGCKVCTLKAFEEANPEEIVKTIEKYGVTTIHFVPSMLNAFLDYVDMLGETEKLKTLKYVFSSGEALSANHVEKFYKLFQYTKLINLYGPTEATVDVSCYITNKNDNPIPIGKPIDNIQLYILDDDKKCRPVGMVGELAISGVGVCRGYLNDERLTEEKFLTLPKLSSNKVYMTGDLARLRADGNIEYLGRNDRQVKVRGFRIELGEIEYAFSKQEYIKETVITTYNDNSGMSHLVAFVILDDHVVSEDMIKKNISKVIPNYMVPEKILSVEKIPVTANGKADIKKLISLMDNSNRLTAILPQSENEKILAEIWEKVLEIKGIGINENFFSLGGNSINFVSVLALANERGLKFTFQQLFKYPTIESLLKNYKGQNTEDIEFHEIKPFELISSEDKKKIPDGIEDAYPMSMLQSGLVYQSNYMQGENNYHDIVTYQIKGNLNIDIFTEVVKELVQEQPIFRTSYDLNNFSEYFQLVHKKVDRLPLNIYDLRGIKSKEEQDKIYEEWFWKEQHRKFDFSVPGLVQLHIHILSDDMYKYSISQHNSALDGWSMNKVHTYLFQTYFDKLNGKNTYKKVISDNNHNRSFIALEQKSLKSKKYKDFWQSQLKNVPDGRIPRARTCRANSGNEVVFYDVKLPDGMSDGIIKLAAKLSVPVKDILLAAHVKFLSILNESFDIFMGYEIGGRPEELGAEDALGVFLNTMPFRVKISEKDTWGNFVKRVYETEAEVLPFRRYPMAKIKQDLKNRTILFETVFNFTHFYSLKELRDLEGFDLIDVRAAAITEFPLRVECSRHFYTDEVELSLHYHTAEFDESDIKVFGDIFISILNSMINEPDEKHTKLNYSQELMKFHKMKEENDAKQKTEGIQAYDIVNNSEELLKQKKMLKKIWANVLGIEEESIHEEDDFFSIGGNSLSALKVSLLLDKKISLKTVMQKSIFIELVYEMVCAKEKKADQKEILQYLSKRTDSELNIIFLPYAGGNAINFLDVAKEFEKQNVDISVLAAELPGHDPNGENNELLSFDTVVQQLVEEIEFKMTNKKFVIWGHCVGSAMAIEVTRKLEQTSNPPIKLYLASKLMKSKNELLDIIENAKKIMFSDIASLHAEWTGSSELSEYGEIYEENLVHSFSNDSIEDNTYLVSLWDNKEIIIQTPTIVVMTKDDEAVLGYQKEWKNWKEWIANIELKEFEIGGHYFLRTIPKQVVEYFVEELG